MRKTKNFFVLRKASDPKGILPDWIANQNLGYMPRLAYSQSQPFNNSAYFWFSISDKIARILPAFKQTRPVKYIQTCLIKIL